MADIDMKEYYEQQLKETYSILSQIDSKIISIENKINALNAKKEEKNEKLSKKHKELIKKAEEYLKERIRCERKKEKSKQSTLLENDANIKAMLDDYALYRQEYEEFCQETDTKIQKYNDTMKKHLKEKEEKDIELWGIFILKKQYEQEGTSSNPSSVSYSSANSNNDSSFEDALRRDREARWKHDEEVRREEEWRAKEEQRRQDRIASKNAARAAAARCGRCANYSNCSFFARQNANNCASYRPR